MKIKSSISKNLPYEDKNGVQKLHMLRPGEHEYPMFKAKDPVLSAELFVLRKHGVVTFKERLPQDLEIMKKAPEGQDKEAYLFRKALVRPSPNGGHVNMKSDSRKAREKAESRKANAEKRNGAKRPEPENPQIGGAEEPASGGKKSRKVSDKK